MTVDLNVEFCEKLFHNEAINFREGLCAGEFTQQWRYLVSTAAECRG
jgi:hypothetical protein